MATLLTETKWDVDDDGSPHIPYTSVVYNDSVVSPYYRDGRFVPYYTTLNTNAPISSLTPSATIVTPGPDLVVVGDLDGLWPQFSILDVAITVTGGTDITESIVQTSPDTLTAEQAAVRVANALNTIGAGEILASHTGDGNVTISALAGVTGLTITTWAVA